MADFDPRAAAARLMQLEAMHGGAGVPGMPGTPGGPVQESPTMKNLRLAQLATGVGSQGLGAATVYAGTHLPAPAAFLPMLSGATIGAVGNRMAGNALEPNIRDVWADQLRMKLQGN